MFSTGESEQAMTKIMSGKITMIYCFCALFFCSTSHICLPFVDAQVAYNLFLSDSRSTLFDGSPTAAFEVEGIPLIFVCPGRGSAVKIR